MAKLVKERCGAILAHSRYRVLQFTVLEIQLD